MSEPTEETVQGGLTEEQKRERVHSRPMGEEDPDIAPGLVPLQEKLMAIVKRPVNIQASREIVLQFRGDLLDQPYFTLLKT